MSFDKGSVVFYDKKETLKMNSEGLVARGGHDPPTSGLWIRRSNQLSYLAIIYFLNFLTSPMQEYNFYFLRPNSLHLAGLPAGANYICGGGCKYRNKILCIKPNLLNIFIKNV